MVTPSKPHSPKTPNPPTQATPLPEQKTKKLVDTPATSSGKKTTTGKCSAATTIGREEDHG
jgi:hypothetical protein